MSDQIRQRRNEALYITRERGELTNRIKKLEDEANTVSRLLAKINDGSHVEQSELKVFGLEDTAPIVLKLRLQGLLKEKRGTLENLQLRHRNMAEILKSLTICPACEGQGIIGHIYYERNDSIISPSSKMENCTLCKGTGKINLGDDGKCVIKSGG